jgi:antirestriction protein ArdC
MRRDTYTDVSERIAAELERGALPWIKPWAATPGANTPCNAVSNRPYSGVNVVLLWLGAARGYPTPRFLTFRQAHEAGGTVRGGEHGFRITFMKPVTRKTEEDDVKGFMLAREYTVFNVAQCDGLPERIVVGTPLRTRNPDTRDELADAFIACTEADFREGHGEAYFAPGADFISMPAFKDFKGADFFYNTAFHELGHWTGHKSRLDRLVAFASRFGGEAYAAEELVAELCAAFLCAEFAFNGDTRSAGYIQQWIALLKKDKRAFFTAASKAQAAADYLRGLAMAVGGPVTVPETIQQ